MTNPIIHQNLVVKPVGTGEFGIFSKGHFNAYEIIEACAWLPISQRMQILIAKNSSQLTNHLFSNPDGLNKERAFLDKLAELELEKRLDSGLITPAQAQMLMQDIGGPNKLLDITSHAILLGFGSIYRKSQSPNINWEYDSESKLYIFSTVQQVRPGQELTYFSN